MTTVAGPGSEDTFYDFDHVVVDILKMPTPKRPTFGPPQLADAPADLSSATIGLLVTSGAYYPDQPRMRETGDLSFRLLPRTRDLDEILFAHMTPIRAFALADPNVAYPRDRILELEAENIIGRLADNTISMVGSITDYERLATETAPQIVGELTAMNVDLLLVLPFCPQCHMAAGVLARAIEKQGIPTTSITTLRKSTLHVKPPRASFLNFPLGCTAGKPNEPGQQRAILTAALRSATGRGPARWDLPQLPFSWSSEGNHDWHDLVDDLYRIDNQIRGTVASRPKAHAASPSIIGQEAEFSIRCAC